MSKRKVKILFVKRDDANAKFVTNDILILRKYFDVDVDEVHIPKNFAIILIFIKSFFSYLFRIPKYDLIYSWFADYHTFLPVMISKLFGKKSIICVGGYEATYIPEIEMGVFTSTNFRKKARRFCTTYSHKNCSMILPVDDSLIENVNNYIYSAGPSRLPLRDGIRNMIPGIETPMKTVRLGYDPDIFKRDEKINRERAVVCAGYIMNKYEFMRKGFDMLFECAKRLPDVKFILAGLNDEYYDFLNASELKNLELYKKVTYEELIKLYSSAKVYAQLSLFEGMPSTICEAMLCNCIPVGSDVNGIPEIVGDTGIIVKKNDIELIVESISNALALPESYGVRARERIIKLFEIGKREKELVEIVHIMFE
jgi:glycosyltransferase involved in cell wall biosynthesis